MAEGLEEPENQEIYYKMRLLEMTGKLHYNASQIWWPTQALSKHTNRPAHVEGGN